MLIAMELLRPQDAARELGVSYPTLKQWIYRRKIQSVQTPGGHHRIPRGEIDRLLFHSPHGNEATTSAAPTLPQGSPRRATGSRHATGISSAGLEYLISGRNQLVGRVTSVKTVGLLSRVTLDIGGQTVTAIITRDACRELQLKPGATAAALIKATEVMIIRPGKPQ